MFNGNLSIAIDFIEAAAAAILFLLCSCLLLKARNLRIQKKKAMYLRKHQAYFTYLQSHMLESDTLRPPAGRLRPLEQHVIQEQLAEWIERLSGSHRNKLIALCEDLGLVRKNLKQLLSVRTDKRVEAAYYLGMMRSRCAVPDLLSRMEMEKPGSALFIIARAVAKCATDEHDVRRMVRLLLRHKIPAHNLMADILRDTEVDLGHLYGEMLEDTDPNAVRTALACLENRPDMGLSESLYRLLRNGPKQLRYPALKLLVNSRSIPLESGIAALNEQWAGSVHAGSESVLHEEISS